jgi:hypothetical protein
MSTASFDLVDARRTLLAVGVAGGSTVFNWGGQVTSLGGAVAWFLVSLVLGYATLSVIDLVAARVRGRGRGGGR